MNRVLDAKKRFDNACFKPGTEFKKESIFGRLCSFGMGSKFGVKTVFGDGGIFDCDTVFSPDTVFGVATVFGDRTIFGAKTVFRESTLFGDDCIYRGFKFSSLMSVFNLDGLGWLVNILCDGTTVMVEGGYFWGTVDELAEKYKDREGNGYVRIISSIADALLKNSQARS